MTSELVHMQNQIRMTEDALLRCKNNVEIATLQNELQRMRARLQRMKYREQRSES